MNYKDTLLLPKTDFEMRGNLNKKEPGIQADWDKMNLYERMQEVREGAPLLPCMMVLLMQMETSILVML
ncbi:hypothetical protein [Erysipelothrix piscisicarius]|uniref:hypothetical protein n=1 Tax=Erysipelothrix piscisicarius TaxID=2485784 RepID=UPI002F95DF36